MTDKNEKKKIKAVLFDFDGTIIDTNQVIIDSWQATCRKLMGHEESLERILSTFGEPLDATLKAWFPDSYDDAIHTYREYQATHYQGSIRIYPGMEELILELKERGLLLAIVTSRLLVSTINYLNVFGLKDHFDVIITCEDTDSHKPEAGPALEAMKRLGVTADECVMLGDSKFDILCAQNAGMPGILVNWSMAKNGGEVSFMPDYVIEKPEDLFEILDL